MKVLIIKLSSLGDILHTLPVARAIRAARPDWQLHWLIKENFAELLHHFPDVDAVHQWPQNILKCSRVMAQLNEVHFNYILEMQGLLKTSVIAKLCKSSRILGISPARETYAELLWSDTVICGPLLDPHQHVIKRNYRILKLLNIAQYEKSPVQLLNSSGLKALPAALAKQSGSYVVCAPEARWKSKIWPYWPSLVSELAKRGLTLVLIGQISSKEFTEAIDLRGKTNLTELMSILARAKLVIGSDSGAVHLADAYGVKTLAIHGPTSAMRTGPRFGSTTQLNLACMPCHKRICPLPGAQYMACMNDLSMEAVLSACDSILRG